NGKIHLSNNANPDNDLLGNLTSLLAKKIFAELEKNRIVKELHDTSHPILAKHINDTLALEFNLLGNNKTIEEVNKLKENILNSKNTDQLEESLKAIGCKNIPKKDAQTILDDE